MAVARKPGQIALTFDPLRGEVDRELTGEVDHPAFGDPGVVHHDVDAAEAAHGGVDEIPDRGVSPASASTYSALSPFGAGNVVGRGEDVAFVAAVANLTADIGIEDRRAFGRECERDSAAVAGAGSGDDGDLVLKLSYNSILRFDKGVSCGGASGSRWPRASVRSRLGLRLR
jgi:hypothetical protein